MSTQPNTNIFAANAPKYHAAGLCAIPLYPREKKPVIPDWSRFAEAKVEADTSQEWLQKFPNSNIGLVLGKASGVIMVDIDSDKKEVIDAILKVLPPSPWHRVGKKGMVLAYKYSPIKTHRVKNISGQTLVECLASRTQVVLPPSIHPDTGLEYKSNCELIDVLGQLNYLPDNIEELLRAAVSGAGETLSHSGWSRVTEHASPGSRDTKLTELAGLFAFAIVRGERTLKEAIGMLQAYHAEFIENVAGDIIPVEKHVDNLIKFLHRDVLDKGKVLPKGWDAGFTPEELVSMGISLGEDDTEWDFETIQKYLQDQFEQHLDGRPRAEAVERILSKVARSSQLTKIDTERVLKYISDVSGLGVSIAVLKSRLKELKTGSVKGTDHTEIAQALLKELEQYSEVRYHGSRFMKWGGSHWEVLESGILLKQISDNYGHLDACKRSSDMTGILKVLSFICKQGIKTIEIKGINFANGFLTQELKLVPHNPDYGMVYTLPFRYAEEEAGRYPMFAKFITRCWGQDPDFADKMLTLQEAMCVTLFGLGPSFQRAILLQGAPRSGKTQLLRIIESMVPEEAKSAVPPDQWGDKFLPTQMHGKILNICGELSEKKLIDGQKFKDIIDGAVMPGQFKSQQIFHFKPMVTHWFASNHIPKTSDTSEGFIRRWLMLTFNRPVPAEEKTNDIGDLIAAEEREAIVAWAALAMPRLIVRKDYTFPLSHVQLSNDFANLNNTVRYYLKESGKVNLNVIDGHVSELKLYNSYQAFCLGAGGCNPVKPPVFRQMMRELTNELDFKLKISQTRFGGSEALFEGLTLVG